MIKWENMHRKVYKLFSNSAPGKICLYLLHPGITSRAPKSTQLHMGAGHLIASPLIYMAGTLPIGAISASPEAVFKSILFVT